MKNLDDFIYQKEKVNGIEVISVLGIPYATAKRFEKPEMIEVYDNKPINKGIGLRFPQNDVPPFINLFMKNPMMRKEILTNKDKTDENAHVLNIWTNGTSDKKPVLVFIHGGGFTYGSGTTPLYNGKYLASKGIVVVTINYRLGVLGFMPVIIDGKLSVNRGFYDQQCALKWVRENISLFGGDESNVTLMGQSAGGLSSSVHMMSEESSKYFDKLIVCSAGINECITLNDANTIANNFLKRNKLSGFDELNSLSLKKIIRLKMPLEVLSSPVIDGVLLKENASYLMKIGSYSSKPVMLGTTGDEMEMVNNKSWYKALNIVKEENELYEKCLKNYGTEGVILAKELIREYKDIFKTQFKIMEMPFHVTVLNEMKYYSQKNICYGYRMNYIPNIWNGLRGAYHCAELPYIFGTIQNIGIKLTKENLKQMEIIQRDWIEFIKDGVISKRESFNENGNITLYENVDAFSIEFPHRKMIEEIQETEIFRKIMLSFMKGRDENYIA